MNILGISCFYHDSAAALLTDGDITAAAQEERFTRKKHDPSFPSNAVDYCLSAGNISSDQLDYIVFYEKPLQKFDRLLETYLAFAPQGIESFFSAMPVWLKDKLFISRNIRNAMSVDSNKPIVYCQHHESHAASAFYPSPFERAAILTIDGVGEWDTAAIGIGDGHQVKLLKSLRFPNSLGLLYSAFTYFCGFKVNSGEYKLMGLAPYGTPKYTEMIHDKILDLKEDGSFCLNMKYFNYCQGLTMTSRHFDRLFGGPPRKPEAEITQREMDLAASIQKVTEEVVLRMAASAKGLTGCTSLCLAGGVALNCVANGKLLEAGIFDDIWIQPAAGDAGGALGAALFTHHQLLDNPREPAKPDGMQGAFLGPHYENDVIEDFLRQQGASYNVFENENELLIYVADHIAEGNVVGWFQGRMEYGPRALGNRSIIGDARNEKMQSKMNLQIKYRESFRPFAPTVLENKVTDYFQMDSPSPYMLIVAAVSEKIKTELTPSQRELMKSTDLRDRVNIKRSAIPAVTHLDYSARVQTVDQKRNPKYFRLLEVIDQRHQCGTIINTSFNVRGEPIVNTPQDAYRCFMATEMDVLVLGDCVLLKEQQAEDGTKKREAHLNQFQLD